MSLPGLMKKPPCWPLGDSQVQLGMSLLVGVCFLFWPSLESIFLTEVLWSESSYSLGFEIKADQELNPTSSSENLRGTGEIALFLLGFFSCEIGMISNLYFEPLCRDGCEGK
jgi:hypothetical protein